MGSCFHALGPLACSSSGDPSGGKLPFATLPLEPSSKPKARAAKAQAGIEGLGGVKRLGSLLFETKFTQRQA